MKTIYKSLMSLATVLLLVPAASAQTANPEKYSIKDGVGYNKYVSTTPNANSEYILRMETFVTGGVEATAIPTDFVLVLDASGSMEYDYRPENLYPPMNDEVNTTTWNKLKDYLVHDDLDDKFSRLSIYYTYKSGSVGSAGSGSTPSTSNHKGTRSNYTHFTDEGGNTNCSMLYHYVDGTSNDGYYKIFRRMFDADDGCLLVGPADPGAATGWKKYSSDAHSGSTTNINDKPANVQYNLAIRLKDGTYKYLNGNGLSDTPYNATATNTIMFVNDGNLYRLQRRREAMIDGVEGFVNLIAAENAKDQWADGIPAKHQVAIVRFSGDYPSGGASITPPTGYSTASHVMFGFTEINGTSEASTFIETFEDKYIVSGSTYTDYGMNLAKMLLEDLQTKDGGKYAALNTGGGVNRHKVVVFFTDGEPSNSTHGGGSSSFFGTVTPSLRYGKTIKEVGTSKINGKIYSIDLAMTNSTVTFLQHLSSNYPKGDATVIGGSFDANNFTGSVVPISESDATFTADEYRFLKDDQPIFYKDSNDGDLTSVFSSIAAGNTGQQAGEKLVVMDVMSDSFELPEGLDGKIKFYTAQCIGEKEIDGVNYLAFAKEIPANARPAVSHLWVTRTEGEGDDAEEVWHDLGAEAVAAGGSLDIDDAITYTTSDDGKSITVSGFDFVDMWCGKDEMAEHNYTASAGNTRFNLDADDPNKDYAADGYRGFKLIIEFPIVMSEGVLGGANVPTNNDIQSGLYHGKNDGTAQGEPIITYQKPELTIPMQLIIRKDGLGVNESASFTVQRRLMVEGSTWEDYTSFVLTRTSSVEKPSVKLLNLDPAYYYRVKENGWSWAYTNEAQTESTYPSTEDPDLKNPIVITNTPVETAVKHAEAFKRNEMQDD